MYSTSIKIDAQAVIKSRFWFFSILGKKSRFSISNTGIVHHYLFITTATILSGLWYSHNAEAAGGLCVLPYSGRCFTTVEHIDVTGCFLDTPEGLCTLSFLPPISCSASTVICHFGHYKIVVLLLIYLMYVMTVIDIFYSCCNNMRNSNLIFSVRVCEAFQQLHIMLLYLVLELHIICSVMHYSNIMSSFQQFIMQIFMDWVITGS